MLAAAGAAGEVAGGEADFSGAEVEAGGTTAAGEVEGGAADDCVGAEDSSLVFIARVSGAAGTSAPVVASTAVAEREGGREEAGVDDNEAQSAESVCSMGGTDSSKT